MKADWYFDVISPYAFLQLRQLQELNLTSELQPRPVLFAGLLNHHGQLGPAEIPAKREFTYRQVLWLAKRRELTLRMPEKHPFNPLPLLRMIIARGNSWQAIEAAFEFVWVQGNIPENQPALDQLLTDQDTSLEKLNSPQIKQTLRDYTEQAISNDVFGVPTLRADGYNFWGQDATEMYLDYQQNPGSFTDSCAKLRSLESAAQRK